MYCTAVQHRNQTIPYCTAKELISTFFHSLHFPSCSSSLKHFPFYNVTSTSPTTLGEILYKKKTLAPFEHWECHFWLFSRFLGPLLTVVGCFFRPTFSSCPTPTSKPPYSQQLLQSVHQGTGLLSGRAIQHYGGEGT